MLGKYKALITSRTKIDRIRFLEIKSFQYTRSNEFLIYSNIICIRFVPVMPIYSLDKEEDVIPLSFALDLFQMAEIMRADRGEDVNCH